MENRARRPLAAVAGALALALALAACGSSGDGGGSASKNESGRGPITYVQGKDNTGDVKNIIAKWNALHPDQKVTLKEQSDQADQQHDDLVQHFKAQDPSYDVVSVDVVWTPEFAAQGWVQPLAGKFAIDTAPLLKVAVDAATYQGKLYAAPMTSDGGMLYYRKDLVPKPPSTWSELLADCKIAQAHHMGCYAGQFAKYEGLTVNASEAINAAGGEIVKTDGKTADVDTPQAVKGLSFLADAYKNGDIPKEAITYQEEQGRQAFEAGKLLFLRNWSYVYNLAGTDGSSVVKSKFAVAPEPGPNGIGASTLGGHSLGMSVYSKHKATALDFMKFYESSDIQHELLIKESNAPVLKSLYTDPALLANPKLGYLKTLGESLASAKSRPVTPFYPGVTAAIEENAYAAIKGSKSVSQALKDMQAAINSATSG
ncbi:ABC transporter substrate-binding protein [Streptomyces mirabilis]|uniref:ABC transporter substrate-binding protein n=1 Tax=Streptomyces TaxID=1883 RepID=UPI00299FD659|nr:ABC transporter substrate-binding protein [Streptomyces sp. AK02-04a]MDX3762288.1 ABC transporter substrate-binding protein [Streptomyces sp. AK02-04a]